MGDVEDVVDDLEGEPEAGTELRERLHLGGGCVGAHGAEAERGGEEGGCFCGMDETEGRRRDGLSFVFEIEDLACDELG